MPFSAPRGAAFAATLMLAMAIFFRGPILSGFDLGFGNRADGLIEISILEHWRNVLAGVAPWGTTGYFHPYTGTLGYNDGYFLYGLSYSFWRLFTDPFLADTLDIATFKAVGFVAAYALVSRTLGWGRAAGLFVALLWTVASNLTVQAVHAQLQSVALLPVATMLAIGAARAERDGRIARARMIAVALAALIAAWLLTAYYMAWFTIFGAGLFTACWCWTSGHRRPAALLGLARRHAGTLALAGASFLVFALPFLLLYLPKIGETGGQDYRKMLGYLVTPGIDYINVGSGNYLWGWLFRRLFALVHLVLPADPGLPRRVIGGEHESGIPPVFCVLALIAAWRLLRRPAIDGRPVSPALRALAMTVLLIWVLIVQLWVASPWGAVFELVPGAKGLRVVSRYQLWLVLPLLLLVVAAWRGRAAALAASKPWLLGLIVALLVAENLSAESPAQLSRSAQRAGLLSIPAPPAGCRSFYVVAARRGEPRYLNAEMDGHYPHNVDAMFLSQLWRVPTINGYSTFNPPDWNAANPRAADYDARMIAYARHHGLSGLCRLDMRRAQPWRRALK